MKKQALALATIFTLSTGSFASNAFAAEHTIQPGETLSEISKQYSMTVDELKTLNGLTSDLIFANKTLGVIGENDFYTILPGDTLFEIGLSKDVTVDQLMKWNNLSSDLIFAGETLAVTKEAAIFSNISFEKSKTNVSTEQAKTNAPTEQAKTNVPAEQAKSNVPAEQVKTNAPTEQAKTNVPAEQARTNVPTEQAKTNDPTEQAKSSAPTEQAKTNVPTEQAKSNSTEKVQPSTQASSNQSTSNSEKASTSSNDKRTLTMEATAYTVNCSGCSGVTANGTDLKANPNLKVISVDPSVIPLGTKVWVEGYGEAIAADTGSAIKGNIIDVYVKSEGEANAWGHRTVTVKILN